MKTFIIFKLFIIILITIFFVISCSDKGEKPKSTTTKENDSIAKEGQLNSNSKVIIKTNKGNITIELAIKEAPITTKNFISLAKLKFYDGLTFHRVVKDFVIQGGDPTGTGMGGSNKKINLEILCKDGKMILGKIAPDSCEPVLTHKKGAVAMARSNDPNSASSQFYITLESVSQLDRRYSIFGYVVKGQDIVTSIEKGDKIENIRFINNN